MEQVNTNTSTRRASKRKRDLMLDRLNIDHGKDRPAKRAKIETIKAREESEHPILSTDEDVYCWVCHKNVPQNKFKCTSCYKVYHPKCYDAEVASVEPNWICPQCILIKNAESPEEKYKPGYIDPIDLNDLLYYILERLQLYPAYKELLHPVDTNEHVDYLDYVLTPMDLGTIENKIKTHSYQSTESLLLDLRYLLHNSYIYNSSSSELTNSARQMLRIARQECDEIENCSECYKNAHIMPNNLWFIEPCTRPHLLVWAKLKGYPYWPGKLMRVIDNQADIRFFGDHNRSMIPVSQVYLFSPQMPVPSSSSFKNLRSAIIEIEKHIEKLKQVHGTFEYAPNNVQYDPERELDQIKLHLPNYNLHIPRKAATPGVLTLKKPIKKASTRKTKSNSNIKTKGKNEKKSIDTKKTEVEVNATSIDAVVSNAPVDQNNITNEETPRILNIAPVKKSSRGRKKSSLKSSTGKKSQMKITEDTSTLNQNAVTNIISTKMDTSTQVQNATSNVISSEIDTNTQVQNATSNIISTEKDTSAPIQNASSNIISTKMDTSAQVQNATSNITSTEMDTSTQVQNAISNIVSTEKDTCAQVQNATSNITSTEMDTSTQVQNATSNITSTEMDTSTQVQNARSNIVSTEKDTCAQVQNATSNILSTEMDTRTQVQNVTSNISAEMDTNTQVQNATSNISTEMDTRKQVQNATSNISTEIDISTQVQNVTSYIPTEMGTSTQVQNATPNIISTEIDTSTQVQNARSNIISTEIDTSTQVQNARSNIISTEMDTRTQVQIVTSNISAEMDTNTQVQNATSNIISTEIDTSTQVQNVTSNISTEMDTDTQDRHEDTNIEYTDIETIKKHSITNEESVETKEGKTQGIEIIDITENQVEEVVPPAETPKMNSETSVMNHLNSGLTYFSISKVNSQKNTGLKNPPKLTPLSLNIEESKKTESLTITQIVPEYNIVLTTNPFCEKNNEIAPTEIHKETLSKPETTAHEPEIDFKLRKLINKNQEIQQIITNKEQIVPRNEFKVPNFITKMPLSLTSKMSGSLLTNSNNKVPDIPKPPTQPGTIRSDSQLYTKHGLFEIKTESELSSPQDDTESCEVASPHDTESCELSSPHDTESCELSSLHHTESCERSSPQDDTEPCELSSLQYDTESLSHEVFYPEQTPSTNLQQSNRSNNSIIDMLLKPKEMHAVQKTRKSAEKHRKVEQIISIPIPSPSVPKLSVENVNFSQKTKPRMIYVPNEEDEDEIRKKVTYDVLASMENGETTQKMSIATRALDEEYEEISVPIPSPSVPKISLENVNVSPKTKPQRKISLPINEEDTSEDEDEIRKITTYDVLASMEQGKTTQEMLSIAKRELDYLRKFYESSTIFITNSCATQIEECDQILKDEKEKCDQEIEKITSEYEEKLKNQKESYEKQIQELNKEMQYVKKKQWCAWCLLEAEYMCCPYAYYCSTRCKQSDEDHPLVCSNENLVLLRKSKKRSPPKIVIQRQDASCSNTINLQANNTIQENVADQKQSNKKLFRSLPVGKNIILLNPGTTLKVGNLPTSQPKLLKDAKKSAGSTEYSNVETTTGYSRSNSNIKTLKRIDLPGTSKPQQLPKKFSKILPKATTITPVHPTLGGIITLNDAEFANIMNKNHLGDLS